MGRPMNKHVAKIESFTQKYNPSSGYKLMSNLSGQNEVDMKEEDRSPDFREFNQNMNANEPMRTGDQYDSGVKSSQTIEVDEDLFNR